MLSFQAMILCPALLDNRGPDNFSKFSHLQIFLVLRKDSCDMNGVKMCHIMTFHAKMCLSSGESLPHQLKETAPQTIDLLSASSSFSFYISFAVLITDSMQSAPSYW